MERETENHPSPAVIASGADLTDEQLAALTPEQADKLTSGEPLPIDPRSPLLDQPTPAERGAIVVDDWSDADSTDPEHVDQAVSTIDHEPDLAAEYDGGNDEPRADLLLADAQPDDEV